MMLRYVLFCSLILSAQCLGQRSRPTSKPASNNPAERFIETALHDGVAYRLLSELCKVAPHRLAGSKGADAAVAWGERTMKQLGLQNVRRQKVMVPVWVRGKTEILRRTGTDDSFRITALGGSIATPKDGVTGDVLMVRTFRQLRELGDRAKGKIVFFNRAMPRRLMNTFLAYGSAVGQRSSGAIEAGKLGAVAAIVRSMTTANDDYPHTGAMRYSDKVTKVPAAAISTNDANRLATLLKNGPVKLTLQLSCKTLPDVESANVIGELVGREKPKEVVVIGGHLDAWDIGEGAHDDGAGIAHCLDAARLIRKLHGPAKRTIRVVLFMNEENGVRGGRAYANANKDKLRLHHAAIETDRGGFRPRGFTTTARGKRLQQLKQMVQPLRDLDMGLMIEGFGGVDISLLNRVHKTDRVLLIGLLPEVQRYFDFHHSDRDRIEAVNERELHLGAASLAFLTWRLANE